MNMIEPGSPRWAELVQQGILKDAGRNWFLGDAALEIVPMSTDGVRTGAEENLIAYGDQIGVAAESLRQYRRVASAWPSGNRVPDTSWKVHQMLASRPELIREGMTVTQAHAAMGQSVAGRTGPTATSRARAEQASGALADPEVRRELRRIQRESAEETELRIVANGGRVPSLEEINQTARNPAFEAIDGAITDENRRADAYAKLVRDIDAYMLVIEEVGGFRNDVPQAAGIRDQALRLLDSILAEVAR